MTDHIRYEYIPTDTILGPVPTPICNLCECVVNNAARHLELAHPEVER